MFYKPLKYVATNKDKCSSNPYWEYTLAEGRHTNKYISYNIPTITISSNFMSTHEWEKLFDKSCLICDTKSFNKTWSSAPSEYLRNAIQLVQKQKAITHESYCGNRGHHGIRISYIIKQNEECNLLLSIQHYDELDAILKINLKVVEKAQIQTVDNLITAINPYVEEFFKSFQAKRIEYLNGNFNPGNQADPEPSVTSSLSMKSNVF